MVWSQTYNPLGNAWLSTLVAAVPIVVLLGALGIFRIKAHLAAIYGLIASLLVAIVVYGMPVSMAGETAVFGAAFGLMPIGSIILNVIFLFQLTLERSYFKVIRTVDCSYACSPFCFGGPYGIVALSARSFQRILIPLVNDAPIDAHRAA